LFTAALSTPQVIESTKRIVVKTDGEGLKRSSQLRIMCSVSVGLERQVIPKKILIGFSASEPGTQLGSPE
jgi:hypothetical protein